MRDQGLTFRQIGIALNAPASTVWTVFYGNARPPNTRKQKWRGLALKMIVDRAAAHG
jgi:hypothetical protein